MRRNVFIFVMLVSIISIKGTAQENIMSNENNREKEEYFQVYYTINDIRQTSDIALYYADPKTNTIITPKAFPCDTCSSKMYCYSEIPKGATIFILIDSIVFQCVIGDNIKFRPYWVFGVITDINLLHPKYSKKEIKSMDKLERSGAANCIDTPFYQFELVLPVFSKDIKRLYYLIFPYYNGTLQSQCVHHIY